MGSSGIRAGASNSDKTTKAELDTLGALWAGKPPGELVGPTVAVLDALLLRGTFKRECAMLGGGMSAWRLALSQDPAALVTALVRIRAYTGIAVLVIPPVQEGAYGYFAARQALAERLNTSHVLDIGGGSLQIAGERSTFATALGQKAWHRALCQALRKTDAVPCALQPLNDDELAQARALLAHKLDGIATALPGTTAMTAISRPVSRGVLPAVRRVVGYTADNLNLLQPTDISATIAHVAPLTLAATTTQTGNPAPHVSYLLSDLLLVEGLMRLTGNADLFVAEADLTNLPGLLADERAFAWQKQHDCYLQRLREKGTEAYASDPATCPGTR
ncbi:MAG: hypothetical protein QG638_2448 [Pseudomonadota bacterium]|nr:hypothetical protein [Pseudomonadota bacterium]